MAEGDFPKANGDVLFGRELSLIGLNEPFGDSSDGATTISSNTSLGGVVKNYSSLTIDSTYTLDVDSGSIIFVDGALTVNGDLKCNATTFISGGAGGSGGLGADGATGGSPGGQILIIARSVEGSGTITADGEVPSAAAGPGTGDSTGQSGNNGSTGSAGLVWNLLATNVADFGNGGTITTGGAGGTASAGVPIVRNMFLSSIFSRCYGGSGGGGGESGEYDTGTAGGGGGGGGAGGSLYSAGGDGGAGGAHISSVTPGAGGGGGGGGAGGFIFLYTLDNNSTITLRARGATGGAGGAGAATGGNGGGGGGGAGGVIFTYSDTAFTTAITGGSGGSAGSGGNGGTAGSFR